MLILFYHVQSYESGIGRDTEMEMTECPSLRSLLSTAQFPLSPLLETGQLCTINKSVFFSSASPFLLEEEL